MQKELTEAQRRILLELVILGEEKKMSEVRRPQRAGLLDRGLIEIYDKPQGRGKLVRASEAGWEWVEDHYDQPFKSTVRLQTLWSALTAKLRPFLEGQDQSFASLLAGQEDEAGPQDDLRAAYLRLTGGRLKQPVRLAALRAASGLSREEEDAALTAGLDADALVLYPEEEPRTLTPEDEAAAYFESQIAKHIIFWED